MSPVVASSQKLLCPRLPPPDSAPARQKCCVPANPRCCVPAAPVPAAHQMLCPRGPRGHADWEFSDGGLRVSDRSGTVAPRSLG
jgi:hypothetical protein